MDIKNQKYAINHPDDAEILVEIVKKVYKKQNGSFGGIISTSHFKKYPLDAAIMSLTPYYHRAYKSDRRIIDSFINDYFDALVYNNDPQHIVVLTYIDGLKDLIKYLEGAVKMPADLN